MLLLFFSSALASAVTLQSPAQALQRIFPQAVSFVAEGVSVSAQERAELEQSVGRPSLDDYAVRFQALDALGRVLGSAWMDDEIGKHRPITYLVALDSDGRIMSVEILVYREAHGLEARSPRFTRQFRGKDASAALTVGKDLDAISGATLSCQTLAFGARQALAQEALYRRKKLADSRVTDPAKEAISRRKK
jgi:Na+-translocating ferredoxin:NAD+ oxidoreductase RnfG subunit